jgi:hypothetical protein
MRVWLAVAAAVCVPTITHAGTKLDSPSTEQATPTAYAVDAPASHGYIPDGWAMRATFKGRAMDLQSRDWSEDPHVQAGDIEAGYGWRRGGAAAVIGYEEHDYGPRPETETRAIERDPNEPPPVNSSGVLGFSLVLHGR